MNSITSSIWHTKKEKPTEDKTIFAQHKSFRDGCIDCFLWEKQEFTEAIRKDVIAWTYLDNLLVCEQELIRTRKALEQSEICCTEWEKQALDYKAENIALSGDLERTRKALDVAVDALKTAKDCCSDYSIECLAKETLEQITAEQKDVK